MLKHTIIKRKVFFTIGFSFLFIIGAYCQQPTHIDSLVIKYRSGKYNKQDKLKILKEIIIGETDPDKRMAFSDELIQAAQASDSIGSLCVGYAEKGNAYMFKGDLARALEYNFKAAQIARKGKQSGDLYISIANIYSIIGNHGNAVSYYQKSIGILKDDLKIASDSLNFASAIYNLGDEYVKVNKLDSALSETRIAQVIFQKINYPVGVGYCLGNMGVIYSKLGYDKKAEEYLNKAVSQLVPLNEYTAICEFLISISDIYFKKGDNQTAMAYARRSNELAKKYGLKEELSAADQRLSDIFASLGDNGNSLKYYKEYILYRDSVSNIKSVEQMADMRTNFEVSKKQVEVDLLNQQKRNQQIMVVSLFIILGLTVVILGTLYWYYRTISREKKRSEGLLLNILPAETAKELKIKGKVDAVKFNEITVLFTDFVGFTKYAEHTNPEQLVRSIDFYFKSFDEITTKYGLEKIKTIGDSYMCACGLPTANITHAKNVAAAAKEMSELVKNEFHAADDLTHFEIRIGIHTGPVVAGIVGIKKWQYDIWGDTVNIASRMESSSMPGRINLSETTYEIIKNDFNFEYRGEIEVKNRGALKMYFLL